MIEVLESEKVVKNALAKTKQALMDALNAKKMGEGVAKNITIIIKVTFTSYCRVSACHDGHMAVST